MAKMPFAGAETPRGRALYRRYGGTGRPTVTVTAKHPLLRQIFEEQDRLGVTNKRLGYLSGVDPKTISYYRHPSDGRGKVIRIEHVESMALALDFAWPTRLRKNGE